MNQSNILVCSSIPEEIDLFVKKQYKTLIVGVGNICSTFYLSDYLFSHRNIKKVLFIGSCGIYFSQNKQYKFGYSKHFFTKEKCIINQQAKQVEIMKNEIKFSSKVKIEDCLYGKTNSVNYISTENLNQSEINFFHSKNILFENMETFGLAFVCQKMQLDFTAFYAITNEVGKNGSKEWRKNYRSMSLKLQNYLLQLLEIDSLSF